MDHRKANAMFDLDETTKELRPWDLTLCGRCKRMKRAVEFARDRTVDGGRCHVCLRCESAKPKTKRNEAYKLRRIGQQREADT